MPGPSRTRADRRRTTPRGDDVLLPVASAQHPKISALWILPSEEGRILTIYLKNMQWAEWYLPAPGEEPWAEVGFLAICERAPQAEWYVTILCHEIFLAPDLTPLRLPSWPPADAEKLET